MIATGPLPDHVRDVFGRFVTCEYASLTRAGVPVTWPVTPYPGVRTLDVTTGLAYPSKAERARRDPRVALLCSSPVGSGLERPPTVLVQGLATVRDQDLQANTDRYVALALSRLPAAYAGVPDAALRRVMDWYWPRIWIEVTPLAVTWWPGGDLSAVPRRWAAPAGTAAPPSDPPPVGPALGGWTPAPARVDARLDLAVTLGRPVVTTTDAEGWPVPARAVSVARTGPTSLEVTLPVGVNVRPGPACVTAHRHPEPFDHQQNIVLMGEITAVRRRTTQLVVQRALGDFGLPPARLRRMASVLRTRRTLRPRVVAEARRRGQDIPAVHLPTAWR